MEKAEEYFQEKKGMSVDDAFKHNASYTAIDMVKFAEDYHQEQLKEEIDEQMQLCMIKWQMGLRVEAVRLMKQFKGWLPSECKKYCEENFDLAQQQRKYVRKLELKLNTTNNKT